MIVKITIESPVAPDNPTILEIRVPYGEPEHLEKAEIASGEPEYVEELIKLLQETVSK